MNRNLLLLAWYHLSYYKGRSLILLVCLTVAVALPLSGNRILGLLEDEMIRRAGETPLVIGTRGSRFDLVLHALTFATPAPGTVREAERIAIEETGYAQAIPLFARYRARGLPIVGTTAGYFTFRRLELREGRMPGMFGDCVLGWQAARTLGLGPGDRLLSDAESVFDLRAARPLDMRVTGILKESHSPDDNVVFADLDTTWIIAGIGHGHDAPERGGEDGVHPGVLQVHTRITPENVTAFHFHGDPAENPLTAIIAVPPDARSRSLLLGRYVGEGGAVQALRPVVVVEELLGMLIQLKRFLDLHHALLLVVTSLFVGLVMLLSFRLRRQEMETMVHLGCSRAVVLALQVAGPLILLAVSGVLAVGISSVAMYAATNWLRTIAG